MNARGLIIQCASCRALVVVSNAFVDERAARVGLQCTACGAMTYLPTSHDAAHAGPTVVVDPDAAARANPPERALPAASALAPVTSATPATSSIAGASNAASTGWTSEVRAKIGERIGKLGRLPEQETLAAEFEVLLGKWESDAEHSKFLKKAAMTDQLAFAGQRYRAVLDAAPGDKAAKRAQNEIMTMAMATFATKKDVGSTDKDRGKTAQLVAVAVVAIVMVIAAIFFLPKLLPPVDDGATMGAHR